MLTRRVADRDAGISTLELVIAMTLSTIVGLIGLRLFVAVTNQTNTVGGQSLAIARAQAVMNQMTTSLRLTDTPTSASGYSTCRFLTVNPNEVTFFSNIAVTDRSGTATRTAPTEIDYTLSGGKLTMSTYQPISSVAPSTCPSTAPSNYPSTPSSQTVLSSLVANPSGTPLFTYCSDATDPSSTCTAPSSAASVALVRITLIISGAGSQTQTLTSSVAITGQMS